MCAGEVLSVISYENPPENLALAKDFSNLEQACIICSLCVLISLHFHMISIATKH